MTRDFCDFCGAEVDYSRGERLRELKAPVGDLHWQMLTIEICSTCRSGLAALLRHEPTDWPGSVDPQ